MARRTLHDFEILRVAVAAICTPRTVRRFFREPARMHPGSRERIARALRELGFDDAIPGRSDA